jgi:hypothetical protein
MVISAKRFGAAALAGLVVLTAAALSRAQNRSNTILLPNLRIPPNPNFQVAPNLSLTQAAYNTAVIGRAISQVPPWAYGYNPYPQSVNYGPSFPTYAPPYVPPYTPPLYGSPVMSTYGGGYGGGPGVGSATLTTNPYGYDPYGGSGSSYGGGGGYYPGYGYMDPTYAFLSGTADFTRAEGQLYKDIQTARLMQNQVESARLDYRRKLIDEARYERMNIPTMEEVRAQDRAKELARARQDPPLSDITSARSLNELQKHLLDEQSKPNPVKAQSAALDDDILKHINVAAPSSKGGNVGILRDEGKVVWPAALEAQDYADLRKQIGATLESVVQGLTRTNKVERGHLADLTKGISDLKEKVKKSELSPTDYIEARKFVSQLEDALTALNDPNAGNYFNQQWVAKGRNVADLVDEMGKKGLQFAPAAAGDEWAYRVLHRALASYDAALTAAQASSKQP